MKYSSFVVLAFFAVLTQLSGATKPLPVASFSTVLTDLAADIGGEHVAVTNVVPAGTDPHTFEPTVRDVRTVSDSRIVLVSGLGFESYLAKLEKSVGSGPTFVVVGEAIKPLMTDPEPDEGHDHGHSHSHATGDGGKIADPHWWHSVPNAIIATGVIRDAFIAADPENADDYRNNAAALTTRLEALAKWAQLELAKIPRDRRVLVTSHDALGYFARDHGFEIRAVQGITTRDQPSSKKVRGLIDAIKTDGVKAIFAENIENPKILEEITRETGAQLGGTLYTDGLGTGETSTYEGMMRHNVTAIVEALQE